MMKVRVFGKIIKIAGLVLLRLITMIGMLATLFLAGILVVPAWLIDLLIMPWADCPCLNAVCWPFLFLVECFK